MHPLLLGFHTHLHFLSVASHVGKQTDELSSVLKDTSRPFSWEECPHLLKESFAQYHDFLKGVTLYQAAKRLPQTPVSLPLVENSHLKIYGPETDRGQHKGPVALFVPSLLNHGHIFDLLPDHSFFDYLKNKGVTPLLVEWKAPTPQTLTSQGLTHYIKHLSQALQALSSLVPQGFYLVGYCMGGLLSLASAMESGLSFKGIALLATPWLFEKRTSFTSDQMEGLLLPFLDENRCLPSPLLQLMFHSLEPFSIQKKFQDLARQKDQGVNPSRFFMALEDWLTSLRPLPWDIFKECLTDWYEKNTPYHHHIIAGRKICLDELPNILVVIPTQDKIVKEGSALPLTNALTSPQILTPALGHVGILVSQKAKEIFWEPFVDWLKKPTQHH